MQTYDWFNILLVAILFSFCVLPMMRMGRKSNKLSKEQDAMDILKRRYAKGEIDRATFNDMKREIGVHEHRVH